MVHKVQERTTGQSRVMKTVVRPEGWDDNKLKMEAELLRNLDHPHILRIFSWYEDGDAINIVMEHCEGGELLKVVRAGRRQGYDVSEIWLATAIRQTFEALVYLHSKSVVHKDLKGQNILLLQTTEDDNNGYLFETMPHIVVCDLGIAEVCCRGIFGMRGKRVAGTPATMAPEVWMGSCGPKSDVWSMGCVMFELFANRLPFEVVGAGFVAPSKQQEKWLELHRKGPDWKLMACSQNALNLCKQLLTFKEASRPTASESLRHPWFKLCEEIRLTEKEVSALCKAMLSWRQRNPMQRALCLKMAVGCTCINKFASIFTKFDKDHSGILDKGEVMSALQQLGMDRSTAKKAASALDVNGDNSCEYLEFVAACLSSLEEKFDELLRQEFRVLDRHGRGELAPRDLDPLLDELKPLAAARGWQLADIDADSDGVISFSEFCEYFGRTGVKYTYDPGGSRFSRRSPSSLPMKAHIRIMNNTSGTIEDSMDRIRRSLEPHPQGAQLPALDEAKASKKISPARTKDSLAGSEQDATAPERVSEVKVAKKIRTKDSLAGAEEDAAVCEPASEAHATKKKPARVRRKASQGRLPKEATRRKQVSEGSGKSEERRKQAGAGRPGAEALQPQFSEASTRASAADGEAPRREAARAGGEAPEDQKERPAEQEPEGAGGGAAEGAEEEEEAPQEDAVVINKDDWSMDLAIDLPPQLPHPCSFQLSSDNLHLITTSFIQSPVTSFEKMDAAYCTGCSPLAAFARLQFHLGDHGKHGLQGSADAVDAYDGEQLPTGHCIVSL